MQEKQILNRISKAEQRLVDLYQKLSSGGGGSQALNQTLVNGNNTGGTDILLNNTDAIQLENNSSIRKGSYDFGQNGGVSRICGVDYEDMWQGGFRHVFDSNGLIRQSSNCFNLIPNNTFDSTLRFKVDSIWILDDGTIYKCTDATPGAAVWVLYSSPVSDYKSYVVSFSQSGANPPTITEIFNTVGVVTWTRGSTGNFTGSAIAGTFPSNKTFFPQKQFCRYSESSGTRNIFMTAVGGNLIALSQNDGTSAIDGLNFQLEIRVYN